MTAAVDGGGDQRLWQRARTAPDDNDGGQCEIAIKPHTDFTYYTNTPHKHLL